jgi:hypothetical protein
MSASGVPNVRSGPLPSNEISTLDFDERHLKKIVDAVGHGLTTRRLRKYRDRLLDARFWLRASRPRKRLLLNPKLIGKLKVFIRACERFEKHARIKLNAGASDPPARNQNRNIEAAANTILLWLRRYPELHFIPKTIADHRANLEAALIEVQLLAKLKREELRRAENVHRLTVRKGNWGDTALDVWVGDVMTIYVEATGRPLGLSTQGPLKRPGGPLIRFLSACAHGEGIELSPLAWRTHAARVLEDHPHGKKFDLGRKAALEPTDKCSGHDKRCRAETNGD